MLRPLITLAGLLLVWQLVTVLTAVPTFLLPPPAKVALSLVDRADVLAPNLLATATELLLGMTLGATFGITAAILLTAFAPARRWLMPVLLVSQALPVFALAPLLVLWLGYGIASKVAVAVIVIFFPVTMAFLDGLKRTDPGWLELATVMNASPGAQLYRIRIPAALPALASGLRVAAAVAPIGVVIGEWVGASRGLGYLMLQSNARMQTDLMFAALFLLALLTVGLWTAVDAGMRRLVRWQPESLPSS